MSSFASFIDAAMERIESQQLITGELLSFEVVDGKGWQTRPHPIWSAIAHDALSSLDSGSPAFDSRTLDLLPREESRAVRARVAAIRWRLRTYLAWEEEAGGTWRRCGRHSDSAHDAATTTCAATALLPVHPGRFAQTDCRREKSVRHFVSQTECSRIIAALALRYLGQSGADTRGLRESIAEGCRQCESLGADLPWFAWVTARAWRFGSLPGGGAIADALLAGLKTMHRRDPSFGGAAPLAFALSAVLNLRWDEPGAGSEHELSIAPAQRSLIAELLDSTVLAIESPLAPDGCAYEDSASPGALLALMLANTMLACVETGRYPR